MQRMRSRGDVEADARARASSRVCADALPSLTQAGMAMDSDINVIVKRFGIDAEFSPTAVMDPRYYGDFDLSFTLADAMDRVRDATDHFARLPVDIRNRFNNSPVELWNFVMDPRNAEESVKLGILAPEGGARLRSPSEPPPGNPPAPAAPVAPPGASPPAAPPA